MTGRVIVLVLFCLPAWAVFGVLGPIQWLEKQRLVPIASWLLMGALGGFVISFVTTPMAVIGAVAFAIKGNRSVLAGILYILLALSAVAGTATGSYIVWVFMNLKF
jgi:hypothetical protein